MACYASSAPIVAASTRRVTGGSTRAASVNDDKLARFTPPRQRTPLIRRRYGAGVVRASADRDDSSADRDASSSAEGDADDLLRAGLVHAEYVRDVAGVPPPAELGALVAVLSAQGKTLMAPSDRKGLHPRCVPLAKDDASEETIALLISAEDPETIEVVAAKGIHLRLLAKTAKAFVHKAIVEEEAASSGETMVVAKAAGTVGSALHDHGAFLTLGKELPVYITLRVGKFPDTMEALAQRHLDKNDAESALITCDLYKSTFDGWGRPHWYISQVYADLGRDEEARDAARVCVTDCEWSTMGAPLDACLERCGWEGKSVAEVKEIVDTRRGPAAEAYEGPKTDEDIASEEAATLLDSVAAGERSVGEITQRLAECYMTAEKGGLSKLVMSSFSL